MNGVSAGAERGLVLRGSSVLLVLLISLALLCGSRAAKAQSPYRWSVKAQQAYEAGRMETAVSAYRAALEAESAPDRRALLNFNLGTCLLKFGRPEDARNALTLALTSRSSQIREMAYYNLAHAYHDLHARDKALQALREALLLSPADRNAKIFYEWLLKHKPPTPPPPPKKSPQAQQQQKKPPDLLEQLPMPPPKALQDQIKEKQKTPPGMKPW